MRTILILVVAAIFIGAIAASCTPSSTSQPGDLLEVGAHVAWALAATKRAETTPDIPYSTPTPVGPPADYNSIDLLIAALYEGVSHPDDREPDWKRLESLFLPGARLTPPRPLGDPSFKALSFDEFREAARKGIASRREQGKPAGFFESEIGREQNTFGNVTEMMSAYEARFRKEDAPFLRGVNAIQVVRIANDRWAIVSIVWDTERPESLIPEKLIRSGATGPP